MTEATSQLLVKLYLGWSNIKEDSGRREGGKIEGERKKGTSELPPKSHLGQNNQAGEIKQISSMQEARTRPPGTLLSALSSRPVVTIWLKLPAETPTVEKNYDIIINGIRE